MSLSALPSGGALEASTDPWGEKCWAEVSPGSIQGPSAWGVDSKEDTRISSLGAGAADGWGSGAQADQLGVGSEGV